MRTDALCHEQQEWSGGFGQRLIGRLPQKVRAIRHAFRRSRYLRAVESVTFPWLLGVRTGHAARPFGNGDDAARIRELHTTWIRRIFVQRDVRASPMIIADECLKVAKEVALVEHDHVIVFNEASLYHHLQAFCSYNHPTRTHLALQKDSPEPRTVQIPDAGRIISIPEVDGLHHRYEHRAA